MEKVYQQHVPSQRAGPWCSSDLWVGKNCHRISFTFAQHSVNKCDEKRKEKKRRFIFFIVILHGVNWPELSKHFALNHSHLKIWHPDLWWKKTIFCIWKSSSVFQRCLQLKEECYLHTKASLIWLIVIITDTTIAEFQSQWLLIWTCYIISFLFKRIV